MPIKQRNQCQMSAAGLLQTSIDCRVYSPASARLILFQPFCFLSSFPPAILHFCVSSPVCLFAHRALIAHVCSMCVAEVCVCVCVDRQFKAYDSLENGFS